MRLLVLGGRQLGGRHLVEQALGRRHDVTLLNRGYVPRIVRDSAVLVADRIGHYGFVSSIAVYADRGGAVSELGLAAELLAGRHAR